MVSHRRFELFVAIFFILYSKLFFCLRVDFEIVERGDGGASKTEKKTSNILEGERFRL